MSVLNEHALVAANPNAIWTFTGRMVEPLDPDPATIAIEDIAHSLACSCRFTGHTREVYTVAEHSMVVASLVYRTTDDATLALYGLLHDGTEAYLSDMARPLKHGSDFGDAYRKVEAGLMTAIEQRFSLPFGMPEVVKWADDVALKVEIRDLMHPTLAALYVDEQAFAELPDRIVPYGVRSDIERAFLIMYRGFDSIRRRRFTT